MNDTSNEDGSISGAPKGSKPELILKAEKEDGSYSEAQDLILHSYDGGYEILDASEVTIGEFENWKEIDGQGAVRFSRQELSEVLGQLMNSGGGFF